MFYYYGVTFCMNIIFLKKKKKKNTQGSAYIKVPFYSSSVYKSKAHVNKRVSYNAPKLGNGLPLEIITVPTLSCFKKSYLFQKSFSP